MAVRCTVLGDRVARTTNLPGLTEWTMTFWYYLIAAPASSATIGDILATNNARIQIGVAPNVRLSTTAGGSILIVAISTGTWYFAAMRQTSGGITKGFNFALDGTLNTLEHTQSLTGTISTVRWGSVVGGAFSGRIAAIKLWDVALSDAEVASERLSIRPQRWDGLNEFYPTLRGATERLAGYAKGRNLTGEGTLTDEDPPPVGWGASSIVVGPAAAAPQEPNLALTKYRFYGDGFRL